VTRVLISCFFRGGPITAVVLAYAAIGSCRARAQSAVADGAFPTFSIVFSGDIVDYGRSVARISTCNLLELS
jgi:hypothetical protein